MMHLWGLTPPYEILKMVSGPLLTSEFHQWYINIPKPCNGVDFSEATMRALFFATQPGGSPRCVAFFAQLMGSDPIKFF